MHHVNLQGSHQHYLNARAYQLLCVCVYHHATDPALHSVCRPMHGLMVGYLANSSKDARKHNVEVVLRKLGKHQSCPVLRATRRIEPREELISPYKNNDKSVN